MHTSTCSTLPSPDVSQARRGDVRLSPEPDGCLLKNVLWGFLITDFWMYVWPPVRGGFVTQQWLLSSLCFTLVPLLITQLCLVDLSVCVCVCELHILCVAAATPAYLIFVQAGALLVQYLSANRQIVICFSTFRWEYWWFKGNLNGRFEQTWVVWWSFTAH